MKFVWMLALGASLLLSGVTQSAEPVTRAANPDALFHSADRVLDANKQVVYHIVKDLLEAGHWDQADKYMTERYLQHNPNFNSGRATITKIMSQMVKPQPIAAKINSKVVAVTAERDLVVLATVLEIADPENPGKTYTTTAFDMWRIKDGKADEHWDSALMGPPPDIHGPPLPPRK